MSLVYDLRCVLCTQTNQSMHTLCSVYLNEMIQTIFDAIIYKCSSLFFVNEDTPQPKYVRLIWCDNNFDGSYEY